MLFNSPIFLGFLLVVYGLYWTLERRGQNLLILAASYLFYGWWDWRFLSLLFASSILDFAIGLWLEKAQRRGVRKALLIASIVGNLGLLGFFKYYNFFIESFADLVHSLGFEANVFTLSIVLPVGISFYTFQTLSYSIDVYRGQVKPTRDLVQYLGFVTFFPQLVAGPIERAKNLLDQFAAPRRFDAVQAADGLKQMLWGFFKKIVIADNLGVFVFQWCGAPHNASGYELLLGAWFFAFQVYADFSGYTDIAIGCSRLFGFTLMRNFAYPFFSHDIPEFWRRWHISLSTWFRDYVYIPLGGNHGSRVRRWFNVLVTFTASGFWHGARWTFVLWGLMHGLFALLLPARAARSLKDIPGGERMLPSLMSVLAMFFTFNLFAFSMIFFYAPSVGQACYVIQKIVMETIPSFTPGAGKYAVLAVVVLVTIDWLGRKHDHPLKLPGWPKPARVALYYVLVASILLFGRFADEPFVYFQF